MELGDYPHLVFHPHIYSGRHRAVSIGDTMRARPVDAKEMAKWKLDKKHTRGICECGCAKFAVVTTQVPEVPTVDVGVTTLICLNCNAKFYR